MVVPDSANPFDTLEAAQSVIDGDFTAEWKWYEPYWDDINDPDNSVVGYFQGNGLSAENAAHVDDFIGLLADGSVPQFIGPLNWQDGTQWLGDNELATWLHIWYSEQCLEGIEGICVVNVFG